MKRKGIVIGELLVTLVFVVLVIGVGIFIVYKFMTRGTEGIDNFQQCEGLIGTLSGKKGSCFIDKGCTQPFSADGKPTAAQEGAVASGGKRWQYIGAGFGCKESTYCCIELGENENPVSAASIRAEREKADCALKLTAEGTAAVYQNSKCIPIANNDRVSLSSGTATFFYKPTETERLAPRMYCGIANFNNKAEYVAQLCDKQESDGILRFDFDPTKKFSALGNLMFYTQVPSGTTTGNKIRFSIQTTS